MVAYIINSCQFHFKIFIRGWISSFIAWAVTAKNQSDSVLYKITLGFTFILTMKIKRTFISSFFNYL